MIVPKKSPTGFGLRDGVFTLHDEGVSRQEGDRDFGAMAQRMAAVHTAAPFRPMQRKRKLIGRAVGRGGHHDLVVLFAG